MINSMEDWTALPLDSKRVFLESVLAGHKDDIDTVSPQMSEKSKNNYVIELSYLLGMVAAAETETMMNIVIARLSGVEDQLQQDLPKLLKEKAYQDIHGIEKGLTYARGIVPPEKIESIRQMTENAKTDLLHCNSSQEYKDVLENILAAREMLSY